jgi:hypothetical protein
LELQRMFRSPPSRPNINPLINVVGNQESVQIMNNSKNDAGNELLMRGNEFNNGTH